MQVRVAERVVVRRTGVRVASDERPAYRREGRTCEAFPKSGAARGSRDEGERPAESVGRSKENERGESNGRGAGAVGEAGRGGGDPGDVSARADERPQQ